MRAPANKNVRAADNEETRNKLLYAASAVFADRGFYAATVRDICRRAGVNLALVNYHFGNKSELYTEVLRNAVKEPERMQEAYALFAQGDEPELVLRKVIRVLLDLMIERRERGHLNIRLMMHELARPTPAIGKVVDEFVKPLHDRLRRLVGQILNLSPEHEKTRLSTQSIIGQMIHYAHHSPVIRRLWPDLKMSLPQRQMVADHIADFSLSYLKSASEPIMKKRTAVS